MNSAPYTETLLESANIFKVKKAKTEIKGDIKMSGGCKVNVNVSDFTIIDDKTNRRVIIPYKFVSSPKTVQPVFGADGYAGKLRYPDGTEFKFKVTFPNGDFPRFMDTVVPNVIIARNKEKKLQKRQAVSNSVQRQNVGYVNPNNAGVIYVPVQPQPQPQPQPIPINNNIYRNTPPNVQYGAQNPINYPTFGPSGTSNNDNNNNVITPYFQGNIYAQQSQQQGSPIEPPPMSSEYPPPSINSYSNQRQFYPDVPYIPDDQDPYNK